jgi:putative Holliday junction resolvase
VRLLGLDLGERRIGVAVSDALGRVALPVGILSRSGDESADHAALARLVAEREAVGVVVGLPLSLDGRRGPQAQLVASEVVRLRRALHVPVVCEDERWTSAEVTAAPRAAEGRRRPRAAGSRHRHAAPVVIDDLAASRILQRYLDRRNAADRAAEGRVAGPGGGEPGECSGERGASDGRPTQPSGG